MKSARHIEQEIEDLNTLSGKTAEYVSAVYDWVSTLREHSLLDRLREFEAATEAHRQKLTKDLEEAKKEEEAEDV